MKILLFFTVVITAALSNEHKYEVAWKNHAFLYNYDPEWSYDLPDLVEFFKDLGWNKELMANFEKNKYFCMDFKYRESNGKWDAYFAIGNKSRIVRGIEEGKEFEETLFDGRKATSKVTYRYPFDATWTSVIKGGPKVHHIFYYNGGTSQLFLSSQVDGKPARNFTMGNDFGEVCHNMI